MFSRLERHEIDLPLLNLQVYQIFDSSLCSNFSNKNNTQNTDLVCNMHYAESISVCCFCWKNLNTKKSQIFDILVDLTKEDLFRVVLILKT
jgi:hypothetical protein